MVVLSQASQQFYPHEKLHYQVEPVPINLTTANDIVAQNKAIPSTTVENSTIGSPGFQAAHLLKRIATGNFHQQQPPAFNLGTSHLQTNNSSFLSQQQLACNVPQVKEQYQFQPKNNGMNLVHPPISNHVMTPSAVNLFQSNSQKMANGIAHSPGTMLQQSQPYHSDSSSQHQQTNNIIKQNPQPNQLPQQTQQQYLSSN